ncbi:carboxymuconolactone decarboxylase family protein [Actinomadura welshii]|uniref:carboxymuconolactone decarboxylase family protein n=1 Tax=Actinomadura welshii TaxID=3103817 RepID=UPI0003AD0DB7|nr:carboxymuconolactone decarboxylase family protein [Actinomadura madurae]
MTQYPTRVSPVDLDGLSGRQEAVRIKMGPYGESGTSTMMKTFLNYPEFARSIGRIGTRVTLTGDLPPRLAGLASLRTAWLGDSEYLWAHIRERCLEIGLNEDELAEVAAGVSGGGLSGMDRHIVEAIDELHRTHYLNDEKWYRIGRLGPNALMDIMTTYGFFVSLAAAVNSMGVPLEDGLTGWGAVRDVADHEGDRNLKAPRSLPKRVFEADYANLSPRQIEQANRMGRRGKPSTSKLQKAMINYPEFLQAISPFGKRAIDDTCLPPRVWQLACMRTVWLCDSEYLWSQHRKASLKLGVTDEDLLGVAEGPESSRLESFDRVVVSTVDDMYHRNRISDENWKQFDQFGPEGVTDLILVYGLYVLQSCVARNFGTTLEEGSVGYLPELDRFRDGQQRTL